MKTTIDSIGRIVVPKALRDALGLRAGSTVDISRYGAGLQSASPPRFLLGPEVAGRLPQVLGKLGIAGGAAYDALVALTAAERGADLATRDGRARSTYETVGVRVLVAG